MTERPVAFASEHTHLDIYRGTESEADERVVNEVVHTRAFLGIAIRGRDGWILHRFDVRACLNIAVRQQPQVYSLLRNTML